ncbi:MAG TPA: inositol oxygenase family protein [Blastocatellia bacterium]|jgi:inositol oxygenase|nr:inositol oxygenase family protein [Blastocatellia bacterium]
MKSATVEETVAESPAGKGLLPPRKPEEFRDYRAEPRSGVKELYKLNHTNQTLEFVLSKKREYLSLSRRELGIWEAMELLDDLVDSSDPDTDLSQINHNLQTAEAIRQDGHPRWFVLAGFIHDLGKILCMFGEQQWAVVGDTFPVGCAFSDKIVYPEFFAGNRDQHDSLLQTRDGIYSQGCGLENVHFSWGHDEYLYHVVKDYLPEEASYMIRYHSCYVIHQQREYGHLMSERDREMFNWVRAFSAYDLYSKSPERPDIATLKPFYQELIAEFFPPKLNW